MAIGSRKHSKKANSKKLPDGVIAITAAYAEALIEGVSLTCMGLKAAMRRNGCIVDIEGKSRVDAAKFRAWLDKAAKPAPDGWASVFDLSARLNISAAYAYILIDRNGLEKRKIGTSGKIYVNANAIAAILKKKRGRKKAAAHSGGPMPAEDESRVCPGCEDFDDCEEE